MIGTLSQEKAGRGRPGAVRASLWPVPQRPGTWCLILITGLAWLALAAIVRQFTATIDAAMLLGLTALLGASDEFLALASCGLPSQRKLGGHALAAALTLFLTLLLVGLRGCFSMTAGMLAFLFAVVAVALAGGFISAVLEALAGALLLHWFVAAQRGSSATVGAATAARLGVFVVAAAVVGLWVEDAARRGQRVVRAAEADRTRAALLVAVSHDLRTPLTAAKAAVSCLRSHGAQLTVDDHGELLAAAEESLDQLTHLLASLLDMSRLQPGVLAVFSGPADLGEIVVGSLRLLGPQARSVLVNIPCDLPNVVVDPAMMERVVVNLVGNALRYSPAESPPLLTAGALGTRVVLRVVDRGPGIPVADWNRAFLPFQRLGETGNSSGLGLGLVVSRGLAEAMGGTVEPEETPGGGLTMAVSLPAARGRPLARSYHVEGPEQDQGDDDRDSDRTQAPEAAGEEDEHSALSTRCGCGHRLR